MYRSGRSAWCTKAELSDPADSETTKEDMVSDFPERRIWPAKEALTAPG